jgi:HPr kinase/phosphorylase
LPETLPLATAPGALHASAAAWCGRGVLLLGPPAAGKSTLLAGLLAAGAYLVADDLVRLTRRGALLLAAPVAPAGLIELRGNGIFRLAMTSAVPVNLCVELGRPERRERLPERRAMTIGGVEAPYLHLTAPGEAGVARILVALAARRVD